MTEFFISASDPRNDVQRCKNALLSGTPITITGADDRGEVQAYTGVIQSVEDMGEKTSKARRWRVTILTET